MTSVLVTGATDGLGRVVAADLAARGFAVHVHGRNAGARRRRSRRRSAPPACISPTSASLAQVRSLAEALPPLDVLVNNAGLISERRVVTGDGIELTFQVNHLAPFLLTTRLLEHAPPRRVVHVASAGQERPDFGDLMLERGYDEWRAYRQSKLAQIMFSFESARRFPGVESVALHPATFMDTKMVRSRVGTPSNTVQTGADATVRLAAELDLDVQGRYFDGLDEARADALAYDPDARKRLWDVSEQLVA